MDQKSLEIRRLTEATKKLEFNTSELTWTEQKFDLLLKLDANSKDARSPSNNFAILHVVQSRLAEIAHTVGTDMAANARLLVKRGDLNYQEHGRLFPWFPWPDRSPAFLAVVERNRLREGLDLEKPLAGQYSSELKAIVGLLRVIPRIPGLPFSLSTESVESATYGVPIGIFEINSVGFEEGSFWNLDEGTFRILTLAFTLLTSTAVYNIGHSQYIDYEARQEISDAMAGQPAVLYSDFQFSLDELHKNSIRAFDYEAPGISESERMHRIALMQLALRMELGPVLAIDGVIGKDTKAAMNAVGHLHDTLGSIRNPKFKLVLLHVLLPPSEKNAK